MAQKVEFVVSVVDQASAALKNIEEGVKGIGENGKYSKAELAAAGTAIIGTLTAIGVSAVNAFADFEKQMSSAKAVLWLFWQDEQTKKTFEDLTKLAMDLWATTKFTAQEAAEGITIFGQAGFDAAQIFQALPAALDLAAAQNISVAQSADIASSVLRQYGKDVSETSKVMDILSSASIKSNATILDLSESFNYFWPTAKVLGITLEESAAAIGILANAGLKGSVATRALGTALTRLADPTEKMAWGMKDAGLQAFDAQGKFVGLASIIDQLQKGTAKMTQEQKAATIAAIFGADAYAEINILLESGADGLKNFTKELEKSTGTTKTMAAILMDNLRGSFELLSGAVDSLKIKLWKTLEPAIRFTADALTMLANGVGAVFDWFNKLPAPVRNITMILVAVSVLAVAAVSAFAILSVSLAGVGAAFVAIGTAALPFIGWAAAIGVAAYALYEAFQNNFLGIRDLTIAAWWAIKAVIEAFVPIFKGVWDMLAGYFQMTFWSIIGIFKAFFQLLTGDTEAAWETIRQVQVNAWEWMIRFFSGLGAVIGWIFSMLWEGIKLGAELAWSGILYVLELAVQALTLVITGWITIITTTFKAFWQLLTGDWRGALATISTLWSGAWEAIKKIGTAILTEIGIFIIGKVVDIVNWFTNDGQRSFTEGFHAMIWGIANVAKTVFNGVIGTIESFINWTINALNDLIRASNRVNKLFQIPTVDTVKLPRFAHGGMVEGFAGNGVVQWPNWIDKVPAMLSAGEVVLNAAQQGNVANQLKWGGGTTIIVQVEGNNFYGDDDEYFQKVGDKILGVFKQHTGLNSF